MCLLPRVVGCWLYAALAMWPTGTHPRILHLLIHSLVPEVVKRLRGQMSGRVILETGKMSTGGDH